MSSSSSVQAAKQALGNRLREIRVTAGLTGQGLASHAGWDRTKISKIEHGRTTPTAGDIRVWCEHTQATEQIDDLVASLHAVEGMYVEWRRMERTGLRRAQESATPAFEQARRFRAYDSWLVPGLLQSAAYTRAVLTATAARRGLPADVEAALAVRMDRQRILREGGRTFAILIEEVVLYAGIGGTATMLDQLEHLRAVASLPTVSLGIIPFRPDRTLRPVEGFWIFDDERVTVELVSGWLTLTQPHEIALYTQAFDLMLAMAVYGSAAAGRIAAAIAVLEAPESSPSIIKHTH
jgi:transcriptional regulator with XRE-family HTH domain